MVHKYSKTIFTHTNPNMSYIPPFWASMSAPPGRTWRTSVTWCWTRSMSALWRQIFLWRCCGCCSRGPTPCARASWWRWDRAVWWAWGDAPPKKQPWLSILLWDDLGVLSFDWNLHFDPWTRGDFMAWKGGRFRVVRLKRSGFPVITGPTYWGTKAQRATQGYQRVASGRWHGGSKHSNRGVVVTRKWEF